MSWSANSGHIQNRRTGATSIWTPAAVLTSPGPLQMGVGVILDQRVSLVTLPRQPQKHGGGDALHDAVRQASFVQSTQFTLPDDPASDTTHFLVYFRDENTNSLIGNHHFQVLLKVFGIVPLLLSSGRAWP